MTPLQDLFRGTAGKEFSFVLLVSDPPRGCPFGAGSNHRNWLRGVTTSGFYLNSTIFIGKSCFFI